MPGKRKSNLSQNSSKARGMKAARIAETSAQAEQRLEEQAERQSVLRSRETEDQMAFRRREQAERQATLRGQETEEQSVLRRREQAERQVNLRATETTEQIRERQRVESERQVARRQNFSRNNWEVFKDAAFSYDTALDYSNHRLVKIGNMNKECRFCEALKWKEETAGMCCSAGKVNLPLIEEPEEPLRSLLSQDTEQSRRFLGLIRKYNSCFQMTSFGADSQVSMPGFSPTFKIQGQVYHRIGSLLPVANQEHKFLQIYFIGDEDAQIDRRCQNIQGVERNIILGLQRMLHEHNSLINTFKSALENMPNETYKVVIHADRIPRGEHERRYNAPVINEVAALVVGNEFYPRDILLHARDNTLKRIPDTHRFYDALQYPLIFWKGQEGYHFNIPQINPVSREPTPNKKVSSMDFYAYLIMIRQNDFNILVRCRQLFHQFLVDMYVKVESERLRFITLNQSKLRVESYIHLRDAVSADANINPNDLGQIVILPSSFVNSPRYLHEYTQDAFAYVRAYGRPDLFITFTCNPSWKELSDELMPGQKSTDRHDLIARVFRLKVQKMVSVITKGKLFGTTRCFMYSIEWQKRGLPHVHILLWLQNKLRPTQIDDVINAEIPDPNEDKELHDIVIKNMIHGPCGIHNTTSPCMKDGKCTKKYPRALIRETRHNENGYPLYKRRAPAEGGRTTTIKIRGNSQEIVIDNSWIVPYSPILSKIFNAHINVEFCSSVRAIKYICKYINKGSDQAIFNVQAASSNIYPRNEVQTYQSGRYVSSNEAVWRLLRFPMHERHPAVIHLAVHLENGQRIYFSESNFQERILTPPKTTLTAFFYLCQNDPFAKTLLYVEVPRYYTWNTSRKEWKRRLQGTPVTGWPGVKSGDALGRVYTIHVGNFECFCLRILLHHIKGPTNFRDLKILNGRECATYREACEELGLLENDNHWDLTMQESVLCRSPAKIRELFALLISTCGLSNPLQLWERYKDALAEDILHRFQRTNSDLTYNESIYNEALIIIEDHIISINGKNLSEYGVPRPQRSGGVSNEVLRELNYDTAVLQDQLSEMLPHLLPEQKIIYDEVSNKIELGEGALFFLDAPGGTGKIFLLNLLLAKVRKDRQIAVAVASSGIAATLLNGGRTAHSVLKLPLNLIQEETPNCNISKNSGRGKMLQECKLLVWDECTMSHKRAVEALNRSLQDLRGSTALMGGMVVLLAGDFRQTLPVIPRGTPADEINASLKASPLWDNVIKLSLTVNMRVQLFNDVASGEYASQVLKIGNGELETDVEGKIRFPNEICNMVSSVEDLIMNVYPEVGHNLNNDNWLCERAILAPKNDIVGQVNDQILDHISGEMTTFLSIDSVIEDEQSTSFGVEFLNSLDISGVPSHKLKLKVGVPVLLMRNLDAPRLCNGTRLRITNLGRNLIGARIRIPIIPTDLPFQFKRLQFPLKVAFAMSINKSQGQTLRVAGIHLETPCFSHGQLYVACSRVSSARNLHVLAPEGKTYNIVYKNVLQ